MLAAGQRGVHVLRAARASPKYRMRRRAICSPKAAGAAFGGKVGNQYFDHDRPQNVGHCFVALRPNLAVSADDYRARLDALVARAKACPPVEEAQPILMPGEPEARNAATRRRDGIPLPAEDRKALAEEAVRVSVTPPAFLTAS